MPFEKCGGPTNILTNAEIDEATGAAMEAEPVIKITTVPTPGDAARGDSVQGALAMSSVIMGPVGVATPVDTFNVVTAPLVESGDVIKTGVITGGVIVGETVDALGQLAGVVTGQSVAMSVVTAKKSGSAPVPENATATEAVEAAKVVFYHLK